MPRQKVIPTYDLYKTLGSTLGFEFYKLEEAYNPYEAAAPHRHNYFEILFFNEAGGFHEIDFNTYPIAANSLHFISPEQVHQLRRAEHVTGYVLSFSKDFCFEETTGIAFIDKFPFFNNLYASPLVQFTFEKDKKSLKEIIEKISIEYELEYEDKSEMLSSYLSLLLLYAKRNYINEIEGMATHLKSELTLKFKAAVEKNFLLIKSVSAYAQILNITAGHLNDTVHQHTGKTASKIIHERIVLEAKRLLYHSEKSVKEIAYELGYNDPSYFVKFFKTYADITPEHFRNDIREMYH
jgi:AraC family transcriptional activator of pobA